MMVERNMEQDLKRALSEIVGLRCAQAQNPFGSTLVLDFGALTLPKDALPREKPRGWRRLTVNSPWRVQSDEEVLFDWNVTGGSEGMLGPLVQSLSGDSVLAGWTTSPAWDLVLDFSRNVRLVVFGDFDDDRKAAWFITGTDGTSVSAEPQARPLLRDGSA